MCKECKIVLRFTFSVNVTELLPAQNHAHWTSTPKCWQKWINEPYVQHAGASHFPATSRHYDLLLAQLVGHVSPHYQPNADWFTQYITYLAHTARAVWGFCTWSVTTQFLRSMFECYSFVLQDLMAIRCGRGMKKLFPILLLLNDVTAKEKYLTSYQILRQRCGDTCYPHIQ